MHCPREPRHRGVLYIGHTKQDENRSRRSRSIARGVTYLTSGHEVDRNEASKLLSETPFSQAKNMEMAKLDIYFSFFRDYI